MHSVLKPQQLVCSLHVPVKLFTTLMVPASSEKNAPLSNIFNFCVVFLWAGVDVFSGEVEPRKESGGRVVWEKGKLR